MLTCFTGKAEGILFEDAGDGYGFTQGNYLLTYYVAEVHSSVVSVKVVKTEGSWKRPKRNLNISILLGGGAMVMYIFSYFLSHMQYKHKPFLGY
jgi:alpha-glucosidase